MQIQSNGKARRSPAEWEAIFERFAESGLSQRAFCRRERLPLGSFAKWRRKLGGADAAAEQGRFVELMPKAPSAPALAAGEMELVLPGDVRLRWRL